MSDALADGLKICIVGAGCSGFTTAKRLKDFGLVYDQFEMSDNIGGNWYHKTLMANRPAIKACILIRQNLRLAFEDYPVPDDWPDFPHHSQLFRLLQ